MRANFEDAVVHTSAGGEAGRTGEVVEVRGGEGRAGYTVRFEEGDDGLVIDGDGGAVVPGADCIVSFGE
ncbi:DUF1918 domain-containing protein [Nocardia terpenica]|uniref:DUF1918 domain-containing protein n=1 Tax=Nocardia terpenica TaxID=455432 RepID=UPI0009EF3820|nr:DUF1918 domain-containing protein [Nocardia terpenica]MBF6062129.1 DUF1918 domain-containing protein [Nocardia terpenica]MBF6104217.1 DUF1918 domain-containing protein [Nocardia terpenica]MBF6109927.1 DUF1918 domain-containing protein [Nocardia terpenica]MBF6120233.1 DUF1918 domain-containing protein [Nocardia terpenica]MBF6152644.1 DUF1918 domain-containing protein [Nocardia terpenica]